VTHLYLDCEWFIPQDLFLVGYCYNIRDHGQLYGRRLSRTSMKKVLAKVDGYVFVYGPDAAVIEKQLNIDIKGRYRVINLLKVFRHKMPGLKSYALANIEKKFKLHREVDKYKRNMRLIYKDWYHSVRRQHVLKYNQADVLNLCRLQRMVFLRKGIVFRGLEEFRLL